MTKEISTSQKKMQHPYICVSFAVILKKMMQHPPASLASGGFRSVEAAETQQVKAVLWHQMTERVPASGGGEVTAVWCAGGCRGLKGQLSLLSAREQQEQKM